MLISKHTRLCCWESPIVERNKVEEFSNGLIRSFVFKRIDDAGFGPKQHFRFGKMKRAYLATELDAWIMEMHQKRNIPLNEIVLGTQMPNTASPTKTRDHLADLLQEKWKKGYVFRSDAEKFSGGIVNARTLTKADFYGAGPKYPFVLWSRKVAYSTQYLAEWIANQLTIVN